MRISIVIATYNRQRLLARTLPSVTDQDYPPTDLEIVLVVDGSPDNTADWARSLRPDCSIEVIEQSNRGPAAARNTGAAAAQGDIILFLDDDIVCDGRLVAEHAAGHEQERGIVVQGAVFLSRSSPPTLAAAGTGLWYEQHHRDLVSAATLRPDRSAFLNANRSLSPGIFAEVGGFNPALPLREDFELALRLRAAGVPVRYCPRAVAHEVFDKPTRVFAHRDARLQAKADVAICRLHPDYRPQSPLAPRDRQSLLRVAAHRTFVRLPARTAEIVDPLVEAAERNNKRKRVKSIGLRLLSVQRQLAYERGARDAVGSTSRFEGLFDRRLSVLLYHHVGPPVSGLAPHLTVPTRGFERHVHWLRRRGYKGITPAQWAAWRNGSAELPQKSVLFTFDDGYADLAGHALPVLLRHGFAAVVFVVTRRLGESNVWDQGEERAQLMTAEQIAGWSRAGVEFGAHSRTHPDLTGLSEADLEDEVCGSRDDLERIVGRMVTCFAYPYGRRNAAAVRLVSETFSAGFTADLGVNTLATPMSLLSRSIPNRSDSLPELEWRVRTGDVPLADARARLQIRSRLTGLVSRLGRSRAFPPRPGDA